MKNIVDARGLSCPEPVLMAREALKNSPKGGFTVAVSNTTSRNNVVLFFENAGMITSVSEKDEDFLIEVKKK